LFPQSLYASRPFSSSLFHQQEAAADAAEFDGEEADSVSEKPVKQQQRRSVDVQTSMRYLQSRGIFFAVLTAWP